jgi:hypothetical protein
MCLKRVTLSVALLVLMNVSTNVSAETCSGKLHSIQEIASTYSKTDPRAAELEKYTNQKIEQVLGGPAPGTCTGTVKDVQDSPVMHRALKNMELKTKMDAILNK